MPGLPRPWPPSWVRGKWSQPYDFFIRSYTSFSAWHQQQCRPVFLFFDSSLCSTLPKAAKCVPSSPEPGLHLCPQEKSYSITGKGKLEHG